MALRLVGYTIGVGSFVLQGRIERLRPGIVPAHPGPARGSDDLISPQMLGELLGGVLAPPVRVEDRLSSRVRAPAGRHIDRLAYQIGAHVVRHRVPDCFLRAAVQNGRQVHEPLPGADIRDITHPLHSRLAGGEVPPDQVGARAQVRGGDGGAGSFRRGCAASRPCSRMTERTVSGLVSTPLRAPAAWTLRYP